MKRSLLFFLSLSMISSCFLHSVYAENESMDDSVSDTLSEELGFESEDTQSDSKDADLNSMILLNDLIVSLKGVETSENSRLYLEEIVSRVEDNLIADSVTAETRAQIDQFLETVSAFRLPEVRKEKLSLTYQHNQANALRQIVDDPASLLTYRHSFELNDIVSAGFCRAMDAADSYSLIQNQVDPYYYQENSSLNEEQSEKLTQAVNTLHDELTGQIKAAGDASQYQLSEDASNEFAAIYHSRNLNEKLQFLANNQETYAEYPGYWALLAECSYENGDYKECLNAIETYEEKQADVYIKDHVYADLIPLAVISLKETVSVTVTRIQKTETYLESLIRNTDETDWALRYLASQAYLEMTRVIDNPNQKKRYLSNADTVIRSVVKYLVSQQRDLNTAYKADAVQLSAPGSASKEDKKEIKALNRLLKEDAKTSLPYLSEALILSADLMLGIAEKTESPMDDAYVLLEPDNSPLFLNEYAERLYRNSEEELPVPEITFDKKKVSIPATYPAYDYSVKVTVLHGSDTYIFDDWQIAEVKRADQNDVSSYTAILSSEENNIMKYDEDMEVTVEVIPSRTIPSEPLTVRYRTVPAKIFFFFKTVKLERAD